MRKILTILTLVLMTLSFSSCREKINAGYEGIKVNLYGSDKGVDDVNLVTGAIWYNPFFTEIYEYPTFVQTVDFKPFTINAQDGSEFIVDPTISINVIQGKSPMIFKKYRKDIEEVINVTIYNYVKDAYRIQLNKFTTDYIISHRDSIEKATEELLYAVLKKEGFNLGPISSGLKYPQSIVEAVNAKNKAIQVAQQKANEIEIAKAEAEKLIVKAKAEKEANELRTQALTPQILEQMWIEKWNGILPVYGEVPTLFKDITK